jgi:DNA ligase (NAD+)
MLDTRTIAVELTLACLKEDQIPISKVETDDLVELLEYCNTKYRAGEPFVDDAFYDHVLLAELRRRDPNHEFLRTVEPEPELIEGKTVPLPARMLSTDKAYDFDTIKKWLDRVIKAAAEIGIAKEQLRFRMSPKLDGFAAYMDGERLYTRGDGYKGTDISHLIARGVGGLQGSASTGPGEIVVNSAYFNTYLAGEFENSRNVIASVIKEGEWDYHIDMAVRREAVCFAMFNYLSSWSGNSSELIETFDTARETVIKYCAYDTDGVVIEVTNEAVKQHMGHTNHHHRWQIAYKENTEFKDVRVEGIQWQTAKSGRITPVVLLEPTRISGATVSKVTGHHAGNILRNLIFDGAVVRVCRSGQVIPYIGSVIEEAPHAFAPIACPSCESPSRWDGDFLYCTNETTCPAQIEATLEHFFKTIGNCDGFGPKVIEQLCAYGLRSVIAIYDASEADFAQAISPGIARNLSNELIRSVTEEIEDWRYLAAFSIPGVGKGGCERLLKVHTLDEIFNLTVDDFVKIDGFAEKTATALYDRLKEIKPDFDRLWMHGFTVKQTKSDSAVNSTIACKTLVFTGTMSQGSRNEMEAHAKALGAKVAGSVSSKTDYLVCGATVGANKTEGAKKHGVTILTEDEYWALLRDQR